MYTLKLYEAGVFSTNLGGPVSSLSVALAQLKSFANGIGAEPIDEFVGCRWYRNGTTMCFIIIVDDMGAPIKTVG